MWKFCLLKVLKQFRMINVRHGCEEFYFDLEREFEFVFEKLQRSCTQILFIKFLTFYSINIYCQKFCSTNSCKIHMEISRRRWCLYERAQHNRKAAYNNNKQHTEIIIKNYCIIKERKILAYNTKWR